MTDCIFKGIQNNGFRPVSSYGIVAHPTPKGGTHRVELTTQYHVTAEDESAIDKS